MWSQSFGPTAEENRFLALLIPGMNSVLGSVLGNYELGKSILQISNGDSSIAEKALTEPAFDSAGLTTIRPHLQMNRGLAGNVYHSRVNRCNPYG